MKKLLALGFLGLVSLAGLSMAADFKEKGKCLILNGVTIPGYDDEVKFCKDNTTMLLEKRLEALWSLFRTLEQGETHDIGNLRYRIGDLERNAIVLSNNATKSEVEVLFPQNQDRYSISIAHMINVATCLGEHLAEGEKQRNLEVIVAAIQKKKEVGIETISYPQQIIEEMEEEKRLSEQRVLAFCASLPEGLIDKLGEL